MFLIWFINKTTGDYTVHISVLEAVSYSLSYSICGGSKPYKNETISCVYYEFTCVVSRFYIFVLIHPSSGKLFVSLLFDSVFAFKDSVS